MIKYLFLLFFLMYASSLRVKAQNSVDPQNSQALSAKQKKKEARRQLRIEKRGEKSAKSKRKHDAQMLAANGEENKAVSQNRKFQRQAADSTRITYINRRKRFSSLASFIVSPRSHSY